MVDVWCRLILDTLGYGLGPCAGACGPFVSYLAGAGACGGLDQIVADPEPEQVAVDVNVAASTTNRWPNASGTKPK
jgi:hypothetical protein